MIIEARELYIVCTGPESFEEMKTYSQEEWKNSLGTNFVSNARKRNIEKLNKKYEEIKTELLGVIGEGFEQDVLKYGQPEEVYDF